VAVPDADDEDALGVDHIDHDMRAAGMDPRRWREFGPFAGKLRVAGKRLEAPTQAGVISRRLGCTEQPDALRRCAECRQRLSPSA
jgi:hypothetical protein